VPVKSFERLIDRAINSGALQMTSDGSVRIGAKASERTRQQLARSGIVFGPDSSIPGDKLWEWTEEDTRKKLEAPFYASLARKFARNRIIEKWKASGGPASSVGLPVQEPIDVRPIKGGFQTDFRSGKITFKGNDVQVVTDQWVQLLFVGLECAIRQEKVDEVYAVINCFSPSVLALRGGNTVRFPGGNSTLNFGPDQRRISTAAVELYKGPIADLVVQCALVENDSGDVEDISEEIAAKVEESARALVGALVGTSAEAITEQTWFKGGVKWGVGYILDDVFGIGDDPYDLEAEPIPHQVISQWPAPQTLRRPDDVKTIDAWNVKCEVAGIDDAGDTGLYVFYFLIKPTWAPSPT
jgi:hypothetical protein